MGKILVTASHWDTLCTEADKLLKDRGHEVIVYQGKLPYMSFEEMEKVVPDIDAAIIGLDDWNDKVFAIAKKMKAAAKFGVGTDNIDKESATKHGIKVINAPGVNSNAVAELTVGLILDALRHMSFLFAALKEDRWERFTGEEIKNKTIGLLGFGSIAQLVAKKLSSFDCKVIAFDPYPNMEKAKEYGVQIVDKETVFKESDIISVHIPSTPETFHTFNEDTFKILKDGAYLVNTARGPIVDTKALIKAVESGKLAGAAVDVYENEPIKADDPLIKCGKIICTPHTAAETIETYGNVSLCVASDVADVLDGKDPKHWVNKW